MNNFDISKGSVLCWLRKIFLPGRSFLDFALLPWKVLLTSLAVCLLVVLGCARYGHWMTWQSYPAAPATVELRRNVTYVQRYWQNLTMDIATPKQGQGPFPAPISGDDINVSSAVEVVVSLAGPTDLRKDLPADSELSVEKFIGKTRLQHPESFERASPIHYLTARRRRKHR